MLHAISENVYAGNAMNRRLFYQYGVLLPASPFGHAGQGLMQNVSAGNIGLLQPTLVVDDGLEEIEVDGIKIGDKQIQIIAGPCSVESQESLTDAAEEVKAGGASILRGGGLRPLRP